MFYILYLMFTLVMLIPVFEYLMPGLRKSFNFLIYTITVKVVAIMVLPLALNEPIQKIYFSLHPLTLLTPILIFLVIYYQYKRYKQLVSKSSQILSGK